MIVPAIGTDFFRRQYDVIMLPAGRSLKYAFYYDMSVLVIFFYQTVKVWLV